MPAERINVSFEPRPLELLYHKYGPSKYGSTAASSLSTTPFPQHATTHPSVFKSSAGVPAAAAAAGAAGKKAGRPVGIPTRIPRRQELGDLKKLGRELTKMERVQMFFDMSNTVSNGKAKSRSQPTSAGLNIHCWSSSCAHCSKKQNQDLSHNEKLKDLKSKLKLVAARTLPHADCRQSQGSTSPLHHSSQHVVPLPLPPLGYTRNANSSEDFSALRDTRQSVRRMFFPQPSVSRRAGAVWNYRFSNGNLPVPGRSVLKDKPDKADLCDSSSRLLPSAVAPACSPADDLYETKTATTFDADRLDSEQFWYVFEQLSGESSTGSWVSTSAHSDTATCSARAQRPSTADTVLTPRRYVETRASTAAPLSPTSPRQKARDPAESWPPKYTVVPSWPSVDDPFRFQYFGCNVHRDLARKLHKSRGRRRNGKHGRGADTEQQPPAPPQPQKLKVIVPSYEDNACDGEHGSGGKATSGSVVPSCAPSLTVKSAKSRDSLSMSVCTVVSRQALHASVQDTAVPKLKDKPRPTGRLPEYGYGHKGTAFHKDRSISSYANSLD